MKKLRLLSLATASLFVLNSTRAATFDDVQFWVGSGANQAALVIDWNDGKSAESLLWGYRWNGSASGLDMFQAVVNADSRLFAHIAVWPFGPSVSGAGYDLNGNGSFAVTPSLTFDGGGLLIEPSSSGNFSDSRGPVEAADHYVEGWNFGYWEYYTKATAGDSWVSSFIGAGDRVLSDGVWDGWSFAPGFSTSAPSEPIAVVPEPTALALLSISALFLTCARRRH